MTPATVFPAWVGAFAIAVAINYFAPVMDWVASWTKRIKNKTLEYVVRVLIFSFIEILFNSVCTIRGTLYIGRRSFQSFWR